MIELETKNNQNEEDMLSEVKSKDELRKQADIIYLYFHSSKFFVINYQVSRMNELGTVLPGLQRLCFLEL